jgi:prepilin-type N-terminal cleavage/methylation domain-containing protein
MTETGASSSLHRPPPPFVAKGFTIVEVMVVVAVIGILAAIAFPAYLSYVPRTQASEAINMLSATRHAVLEYRANAGKWPQSVDEVMQSTSGKYTASVSVYQGSNSDPNTFALMARMSALGTAPEIRGATVLLSTTGDGGSWTCASGGDSPINRDYLPSTCR